MGQRDEENPISDEEAEAEKQKLRPNPSVEMEMTKIPIKMKDGHPEVIAGHDDPLLKSHHLRYLLIGFNGFVAVLGIALLAVSIWIKVDHEFGEYEKTLDVDKFPTVCAMLITCALVMLIVGFLGCMGAVSEQRWMLILYMTLFGLIFLIELAAIVIMWYAPYSSKISNELEKQIKKQIEDRERFETSQYFMDFIQKHLHCCGATGVRDYGDTMGAPNSCLDERSGVMYANGCARTMLSYLRSKAGIVGGIALPILLVQLLAIVASGCLIKRLEGDSQYFMGAR